MWNSEFGIVWWLIGVELCPSRSERGRRVAGRRALRQAQDERIFDLPTLVRRGEGEYREADARGSVWKMERALYS